MNERPDRNDDPEDPFGGYRLDGLYAFGPVGMRCVLAAMIYNSLLRVTGSTPEGERKVKVRTRATELRAKYSLSELQAMDVARRQMQPRLTYVGGFLKPSGKRPNSGRKRRVAA
jgi:hypothetical protein